MGSTYLISCIRVGARYVFKNYNVCAQDALRCASTVWCVGVGRAVHDVADCGWCAGAPDAA